MPKTRWSRAPKMGAVSFHCHIFQSLAGRIEALGNDPTGEFVGDAYGNLHGVTAPRNAITFCGIQVADGRERRRGKPVRHLQWFAVPCSGFDGPWANSAQTRVL